MAHTSSSRRMPLDAGMPDGLSPLVMTHLSCPSLYACTAGEFKSGMGGDMAAAILKHLRTGDQIAVYGEFDPASSVSFYTHRQLVMWNGRYNNLELGSHYPDAPRIFFTDQTFPAMWMGPLHMFLVVPQEQREAASQRLPKDHTWLLMESGGKAVYANYPLAPGQPSLAQSQVASNSHF
jgi:hypothetical protein